ncbi:unnamed protein product [Trichogramma brassicae]|uniref:Reverse transcriptase domain-containing protein n=1 Tax=Trichogramma brassicae TaxID=86971 RepID=A0A6H5J3D9_9HYME|nr:unnamed protein product [Trichogramma brassicae]
MASLRIAQVNLGRSRNASDELVVSAVDEGIDVLLIAEPYTHGGRVCALGSFSCVVITGQKGDETPWAAVVVLSPNITATHLRQYSSAHCVCVELSGAFGSVVVISQYHQFSHEPEVHIDYLDHLLSRLRSRRVIIGMDLNGTSPQWSSRVQVADERGLLLEEVLERLIRWRLLPVISSEDHASSRQFGFRAGRSTADAIGLARSIVSGCGKPLAFGILFDITGALDNLRWHSVMEELATRSCPGNIWQLVRDYLDGRTVSLTSDGSRVTRVVKKGAPQGSILGPDMWNMCMDPVLREVQERGGEIVAYADDLLLLVPGDSRTDCEVRAQSITDVIAGWARRLSLEISRSKTEMILLKNNATGGKKVTATGKKRVIEKGDLTGSLLKAGKGGARPPCVRISPAEPGIKYRNLVRYLGVTLGPCFSIAQHIEITGAKASGFYQRLASVARAQWGISYARGIAALLVRGGRDGQARSLECGRLEAPRGDLKEYMARVGIPWPPDLSALVETKEVYGVFRGTCRALLLEKRRLDVEERDRAGEPTFQTVNGASFIDATFASPGIARKLKLWRIESWGQSDHRPIRIEFSFEDEVDTLKRDARLCVKRANWEKYTESLLESKTSIRATITDHAEDVNKIADAISGSIVKACNDAIPTSTGKYKQQAWWTSSLKNAKKKVERLRSLYVASMTEGRSAFSIEQSKRRYQTQRKLYQKEIRATKKESWEKFVTKTSRENVWGLPYKIAAGKVKQRKPLSSLRKQDGSMTKSWAETAKMLLDTLVPDDSPRSDDRPQHRLRAKADAPSNGEDAADFTCQEVWYAMQRNTSGKSPGADGVIPEALKHALVILLEITDLFNGQRKDPIRVEERSRSSDLETREG